MFNIKSVLKWPLKAIDDKIAAEVEDKTRVAVKSAIDELPDVVEDLLNGKPIELMMTIQLRSKSGQ